MSSTYTTSLNLRKPEHRDEDTRDAWGQPINNNMDLIDLAFGLRSYTEQNYIANSDSHSQSLNKLDMALKDVSDLTPTSTQKSALIGAGVPSGANPYATKDYVRLSRKTVLFPEFTGAVFSASPGGENAGLITSDIEEVSNYIYNYYQWLSDETDVLNLYDIVIQWKVPETFLNFIATLNKALILDIATEEAADTNNKVDIILQKDGVATTSSITGIYSTVAGTWYSERQGNELIGFDSADPVLASLVAGDTLNIKIRMYSFNSVYTRVGALTIQYTG